MPEYIEREALIKAVRIMPRTIRPELVRYSTVQAIIDNVSEVKHGQWLKHYQSGVTVSEGFVSSCCDMWNE